MTDNIVLFYLFFIVVGFFTAMLGTIIGAGGGIIFVPLFMYWFPEWSPSMIVGTSLFSVMCNAISGSIAYLRQKKVYISAALIFSVATFPGAILGAQMSDEFSGPGFKFAFGCFLLFASFLIGFKNFGKKGERKEESLSMDQVSYNKPVGIGISIIVGFISSILGIGGGLIHVPALIYIMGFPTHLATATSHAILAVSTAVGVITHLLENHIVFSIAIPASIGAVFGAQAGAQISKRLKAKAILALMSIGVFGLAVRLIIVSGIILL
ncbi:MAG: sulfite exporter TauE/SafE family protein [Veillonella tobetsuensis]|nr:sulfite exporter TauE/SafE family protein [Veillonella tobetsuensis]